MCGIAGLINLNGDPVSQETLKKMTDVIAHRGPDGEGQWIEGNVGIGHRRLSIIDLSADGHQPMISADNRYVLSYNGEVYNYRELRADLEAQGVCFRSQTDSEVVLYSLALWGAEALIRLNGMFSIALWDRKNHSLLLARDRYGIKPLYYSQQGNTFAFGSEQKAITVQPRFQHKLNKPALLEYFTFQNIFTDQTLLEDIHLLPAGSYAVLNLANRTKAYTHIQISQYWDYHFKEAEKQLRKEEYLEELQRLFLNSVSRQLVSDVEVGSYLSGGVDSGAITALAVQHYPNLKTFTCGFDLSSASGMEMNFDERQKAEAMSARLKTEHYEMVLKAGDMERCLKKLAWHLEEPRVGQSYPNYYAAQLASKFVKVVMSGSGGDELFAGYPWRYYRSAKSSSFENYIEDYYIYWQRLIPNKEISGVFAPIWADVKDVRTKDIFRDVFLSHDNELKRPQDYINHSLYFEAKTFLHGLFIVEDKLSMAHSLENRVPFMDNDLVDFAMQCPVSLKLINLDEVLRIDENVSYNKPETYFKKTKDGKQILREMMANYVPEDVAKAVKQGFSAPDASWFKGESIDFVSRTLLNKNAKIFEVMQYESISSLIQQHLNGDYNRRLLIWSLLNVEIWMQENLS